MKKKYVSHYSPPATPQQLASIHVLQQEIHEDQQLLNRPVSALINAVFFSVFVHLLFIKEQGGLHRAYLWIADHFHLSHYQTNVDKWRTYQEEAHRLRDECLKNYKILQEAFMAECKKREEATPLVEINTCCEYLDQTISDAEKAQLFPSIQAMQALAAGYSTDSLKSMPELANIISGLRRVNHNTVTYTILMQFLLRLANFYNHPINPFTHLLLSPRMLILINAVSAQYGSEMSRLIYGFIIVGLGILGQRYLTDPLLLRLTSSKPYIQYEQDAQTVINTLKIQRQRLKQKAHNYKTNARYLIFIALAGVLYSLWINPADEMSPAITLACLAVISTSMKDGLQDFYSWRESRCMNTRLNELKSRLNTITQAIEQKDQEIWELHPGQTLASSYFSIAKDEFLARKLEYSLHRQGISTLYSNNNYVFVSAATKITQETANKIADHFSQTLQILTGIKQLKKQLISILNRFKQAVEWVATPYQDTDDLPTALFQIAVTGALLERMANILTLAAAGTDNKIEKKSSLLLLRGRQPMITNIDGIPAKQFNLPPLKPCATHSEDQQFTPAPSLDKRHRPGKEAKTVLSLPKKVKETKSASTLPIIHWGADCYNPNDPDCPVHVMRRFCRHFIVFKLRPEHINLGNHFYKELKDKALKSKPDSKKQGWKYITGLSGTDLTTKKPCSFSAECRFFGEGGRGDWRLYAYPVQSTAKGDDGKTNTFTLYRVVGFTPHAH